MPDPISCIFSINTGRSGSHYLSELLDATENCDSRHEEKPNGFGPPLRAYSQGDPGPMVEVARDVAARVARSNSAGRVYADTNHCFVKGLGQELMPMLEESRVAVICLHRASEEIIGSTMRINCVPLRHQGRRFILTPDKARPLVQPPQFVLPGGAGYRLARGVREGIWKWRRLKSSLGLGAFDSSEPLQGYQRRAVAWYVEEVAALERAFRAAYPKALYIDVEVAQLNDPDFVAGMCARLGLRPAPAQKRLVGRPTNLKAEKGPA